MKTWNFHLDYSALGLLPISRNWIMLRGCVIGSVALSIALAGCGGGDTPSKDDLKPRSTSRTGPESSPKTNDSKGKPAGDDIAPVTLGPASDAAAGTAQATTDEKKEDSVVAALQPFNTLLGDWEGKTRKQFEGFAKVDNLKWVWDFKTDKEQPAVSFSSDKSPYYRNGWLTFLTDSQKFRLTLEAPDKQRRVLEGDWTEGGEPKQESDGKKMQWSYKLKLAQTEPAEGEQWQVELSLQENNRYIVDLSKKPPRGMQFVQLDRVGVQRKNTSFAVADSDNPGPKCIVSGGLGTISVSYMGKTYYVCCSGCQAAFAEDPERWLAKKAKADAEKKSSE